MIRSDRNSARALGGGMAILLLGLAALLLPAERASAQVVPGTCPAQLGTADIIGHDLAASFCELCDVGTVRIVVENPFGPGAGVGDFTDLVVTENLMTSGLTYVPGSTSFIGINVAAPPVVAPTVSGANGSILTWDLGGFTLPSRPGGPGNRARLIIEFDVVRHPSLSEEGLVAANRTIAAQVALTPECAPAATFTTGSGPETLPLREPVPVIRKRGRNLDAGQGSGSYTDTVYGHENDDVIWRIEIQNNGLAPLQDFEFSDSIVPGNFDIDYVCDTEADATAAANGAAPSDCVAFGGTTTSISDFDVADEFGGGANPYIVAAPGATRFYYLVGEVTNSCVNRTNTVFDVEWGCQSEPPPGGIAATSTGTAAGDTALLSTLSVESGVDIDVDLTGINTSQPMGTKGRVRIRITNNSGGTIKHEDGIRLRDLLPPEYVIDTTFTPTISVAPAYGNSYPGMVDTLEWTNPEPGTVPLPPPPSNPAPPLANTDLDFLLTSSSVHPEFPDQFNMIRRGDVVTIIFRTILIDPQYYDLVANLDVRTEAPNSDPPGTDPTASFPISNHLEIWYEEFCTTTEHHLEFDDNSTARPEDLDVDVVGSELVFILTNTGDPLPLTVRLTNNGGHDARDYFAYVTFGEAMTVQNAPSGCTPTANPPAMPVWQLPTGLPATASVYQCTRGVISPGEVELMTFQVVKNTAASFDDDLTFRADVIGEITLSNGTPLWFPTPVQRPDGILDRANNYTIDGIWARVIGYNLFKNQLGVCTENNPPPGTPDDQIQIGEECSFHVESGGWFGFRTPGFTYIAVQDIQLVDQLPDGQGYISSTDPQIESTSAIQGVSLNPPPAPLADAFFDWTFNTVVPDERITEKDHWFRANVTTRLLNDPIDTRAAPNVHAAPSTNVMVSTFEAVFFNDSTGLEELYNLGPSTVGYPREVHRRVDLTVTEPNLILTKEVCNETRYGAGPACTNFVPLADDGDAFDTYVYRVTIANEAASGGVTRAPAYDVTVTSVADPSDQLFVDPLTGDALDNDADAPLIDAGDAAGEGVITDNTLENAIPAQVIAAYTHSDALLRIDAGQSAVLYYRVDPDDDVAPLQQLTNTVTASYDSLEGASGAQTPPPGANGELGGARQYVSAPAEASIRIIPVEVTPKQIVRLSNTASIAPASPQPVSIGEEIEFELRTLIPVSQLRSFVVRDELPPGLSCSEAPVVDLDAPPYSDAGFMPGGSFTPTCTDTEVVWDFGNQTVTQSPRADRRFDFRIRFVARVDNEAANQDGVVIRNGGTATVATVSYIDEAGNPVLLVIGEAAVVVAEPVIALTKAFSVASVDAADLPRVTVTATNTGTATAYNLRVLDDLAAVDHLIYAGDIAGTNPPTADLTTFGPNSPLFVWPPGFGIAPGETVSFSFAVEVDGAVEPLEILDDTIQADFTSLPGSDTALNSTGQIGAAGSPTGMRNGALPNAGDPLNDYEAEASASVAVPGLTVTKVALDPAFVPEIGAHQPFQVTTFLPEGTTQNLVVSDDLASGSVSYVLAHNADFDITYEFIGITTINGLAPGEAAFTGFPADATSGTAVWSIGSVVTETEDDLVTQAIDPAIRITYFARVNNDLATNAGSSLQNTAQVGFTNGETGAPEVVTDDTPAIVAIESAFTATKTYANVTPGKAATDPATFDDILEYVIVVQNGGNATAYDVNLVDTPPAEVQLYAGFTPTASIGGTPVPGFVAAPAGAPAGPLVWGLGNGDASLDVPAGSSLVLTYQVVVTQPPGAGSVLSNGVLIDWTSLDAASVYERTGVGCPAITPPDDYCIGPIVEAVPGEPPAAPDPLLKENTQATAAVGEVFRYLVTIPETPYAYPLYDVVIADDLTAGGATLRFIGVTKISTFGAWTPVNTGTDTSLVIEDPAIGIDVPAGEQAVVEIAVVLEDTPANVAGVTFTNTADYTWNFFDEDDISVRPGAPGTSPPMTIVEPVPIFTKTGPPTMTLGTPGAFTLDVHNTGGGTLWNPTITDLLPDGAPGGTCDAAPTAITAEVFDGGGTSVAGPLAVGTDFTVDFLGAPDCTLTLTFVSAAGAIGPDHHLIVTYETPLDADTPDGAMLTDVAGVTEWFSADATSTDRRTYAETITTGTVGTDDHEDAHTVTVELPAYLFEKTVANVTSGANPATTAVPGDTLHYRLRLENTGTVPMSNLTVFDDLDVLNAPAAFQAGTLVVVTVPAGADASNTSATGGSAGTGVIDIRDLALAPGESLLVEFEIALVPVIANGTVVTNQSQLQVGGVSFAISDDPAVNGPADPFVAGDEDPTRVLIQSAPAFLVEKISTDLTGDPNVLLAGETLRYTITVKNVGTADAVDAFLQDAIPVNTQYVPGSTTLNGAPVADGPGGSAPLSNGIPIHAPEDPTPGAMRADASATPDNVATLTFDVVVDAGVPDGTIIANQGFVSAVGGGVSDQPSDDPRTPIPDDPTRNVVGNSPLLFAPKQVALAPGGDLGAPGIVEPGDTLRYTITVFNSGAVAATGATIQDAVPANTTYVPDTLTLNGLPVGPPGATVSPLVAGFPISSSDLTPPLPGPGAGTITSGESAVIEFDLVVNGGVPDGTIISNQAVVSTAEVPSLPTDGDGDPTTGPEPTQVVVGAVQQLSITKQVAVVGGGAALAGAELEYVVRVVNIAAVPAFAVVITDDLDADTPGYLSYVAGSATLNGSATGVSVLGSIITADYSGTYGPLAPGGAIVLRFRAVIDPGLAIGTTVTNTGVVTWNTPPQTASASVSVDVGGMPGVGVLNGRAWHDADFDDGFDQPGEAPLQGWIVEAYRSGVLIQSALTDAAGAYRIGGLAPTGTGAPYELRFRAPDAGANTAALGVAVSPFTNGLQLIRDIVVPSGANLLDLNLPIDPNGVVYTAIGRTPVSGATLTLLGAGAGVGLPSVCFDDPLQQGQVTRGDGYYKFDLNFSDPACPSGGSYLIAIVPPGAGFVAGYSQIIPPTSDASTAPLSVPTCPGTVDDALPSPQYCEAQPQALAPTAPARSQGTNYHVHLTLDGSLVPGSSQIFNNHIPVDPVLDGAVTLIKTTPTVNVSRGQLVPYEIRFVNAFGVDLPDLSIVDRIPPGFRYVEGSARIDGAAAEPTQNGRELTWTGLEVGAASESNLLLLLAVGAGVGEGEYVNRAQVRSLTGAAISNEAFATVRVVPDPTFACTDVLGKVFDDANRNGVQDGGESGLAGIRLVTARGLVATTDQHGRFHITCAVVPREERGSNFVLKLDDRSLPSGYRMSTRKSQVQRASYGKALRFHFGASLHRVVGLDVADAVFEPGSTRMRPQWQPRLGLLLAELDKEPSILRLSYVADLETPGLVDERLDSIKQAIAEAWGSQDRYQLSIETEVFWRRGAPADRASVGSPDAVPAAPELPSVDAGPPVVDAEPGRTVERHLPSDAPFMQWSQDPARLETESGDRLEQRPVLSEEARTVKLTNLVPPIRFESGVADIPPSTIERLRGILDSMRHLRNVRLHLVGHADDQPLSPSLSHVYGDNEGLSRERAGEVAEFVQTALGLPPESISFAWAGDSQPIASNATAAGRAQNRRVEVEVWYDELDEKLALEDVVVPADIKRVKVCRTETVCKLRYREGHARRARVRNLIAPLHYGDEAAEVSEDFVRQIEQAFHNLRSKQNVSVKFVGFTDDVPLTGRAERIYGTHLSVSKAQAHRVALAIQDALDLPTAAIASDGRGATRPLASNDTERGRALNRRIEVEFWHDDPLQELPDEPQRCPDAAGAELVTVVYDPPWGRLAALPIENGEAQVPPGYADDLRRALADVAGRTNARLQFVGYTRNERLDRRTAVVYGDDVGLSAARARRTMETIKAELGLKDAQAEHEGRGYVHSGDVVNAGFLPGDTSHVAVQVVYDELALLDDYEGVDITPITRELRAVDPLALNLMRITVDGQPIDDPSRSSADIQRCTDVALDRADIQFRFDNLESNPRLSVASEPIAVPVDEAGAGAAVVRFRMYTNYPHFIERAEVRIFERGQSVEAEPVAVAPVGPDGVAHWQPTPEPLRAPVRELTYVLRAYGGEGRFDETTPQSLWMIHGRPTNPAAGEAPARSGLLAGYGESGPLARNIPLGSVGTVEVHGRGIPPLHSVWLAGSPVPVDDDGNFVAQAVLPSGMHTVEVAVLDPAGNGELFLRDLAFEGNDWFYVGMADLTLTGDLGGGPSSALVGHNAPYDPDSLADGRLAFFLKGKFGEDWRLTASADTREEPVENLFSNFLEKSPESLFRRIDPDYHYPAFGDDGTVEEAAPTSGKLFVKLNKNESHALWGNFDVGYLDNELAHVDRGLYGANLRYQSLAATSFGEERLVLDGFAAEPGTVASREEFRGTGGSLYYLRRQDLLTGSERVRVEVRDKVSGLVTGVVHLRPTLDYDIDYLQGRILLTEPIGATVDDGLVVHSEGSNGDEAWLVVQYEYTPGFDEIDALATGGQGHYWLNDFFKLGLTVNRNDGEADTDSNLYAADLIARKSSESWIKLQAGRSEGLISSSLLSDDGGFRFLDASAPSLTEADANAYRADVSIGFADFLDGGRGQVSVYLQNLDAGYSAPGMTTFTDTQLVGGAFDTPLTDALHLTAKADRRIEKDGLETTAQEVDLGYQLTDHWNLAAGVRNEQREDDSPLVPVTQEQGKRTDAAVQVAFDPKSRWSGYGFAQSTLAKSGDREDNGRLGVGGAYRVSERLLFDGEVSHGDLGPAVKLGTSFQQSEETHRYWSYAFENERGYDGLHGRRGNLISGVRTRMSDSASVYVEDRYQHGDSATGLARAMGMNLTPSDRWSLGANWELGTLLDSRTHAETDRKAGGARLAYGFEELQISSGVEYRFDETEQLDGSWTDRTTWLFRNTLRYQMTPSGRVVGKLNHSFSESSLGTFYDGGYTEGVLGYAYRPVKHDRLDALAKYTYFYNVPTTDQLNLEGNPVQFLQKSHIAALDVTYDLTRYLSIGGKYAYRLGQVSLDRENPDFFDNSAHLYILRTDYRFLKDWEGTLEGRMLELPDLNDRRSGALFTIHRYLGDHFKVGVGYNFTDFSEDLTDLSYDHHGLFLNLVGTM